MNGILNRGQAFINYLISPKVPIGKRITIVAGILYLVSPLSFPGPIDELVVLSWLMPFVNGELEAFDKGIYNCNFLPKESKQSRTGNPILDIFEETDALIERTENKDDSNPLLRLM
jgi:hypothetical protein